MRFRYPMLIVELLRSDCTSTCRCHGQVSRPNQMGGPDEYIVKGAVECTLFISGITKRAHYSNDFLSSRPFALRAGSQHRDQ
jgi:hypothetical protein